MDRKQTGKPAAGGRRDPMKPGSRRKTRLAPDRDQGPREAEGQPIDKRRTDFGQDVLEDERSDRASGRPIQLDPEHGLPAKDDREFGRPAGDREATRSEGGAPEHGRARAF